MTDREHQRVPYSVEVEFRTPSSFLVAYSVNLSRGGIFLETPHTLPEGSDITLQLRIPGAGEIALTGIVSWRRERGDSDGPAGLGVAFDTVTQQMGTFIDRLISEFEGLNVLLLSKNPRDRISLKRLVTSIVSTAEVVTAADPHVADTLITDDIDLVIVDTDTDTDGALATLRHAAKLAVPSIALAASKKLRERARAAGAAEVTSNPPPFAELQRIVVRALGRPARVKG